jgi:maltose alpha-D-glucosyltransferase/alpha-amylase
MRVRRKIELMNALLLSLPGTPVLYYGDEIGMGDNIYLGDRDGVRTPMQWSSDRNAGFSRANPQKLFLPPIIDPEYHYEAINVEAQQGNQLSLLWWMKRLIAKRKEHRLFGRGSIEFLAGDNPRVLAFVREHEGEAVLVVANLSRFVQCVRLELGRFKAMMPIELFGQIPFPEITDAPYFISLGPHNFYWLALSRPQAEAFADRPSIAVRGAWTAVFELPRHAQLARALVAYATQRRWFRGKARPRKRVSIADVIRFPDARFAIVLLTVEYEHGAPETYVMPVLFAEDPEVADSLTRPPPSAAIATLTVTDVPGREGPIAGALYDAVYAESFAAVLLATMTSGKVGTGERGRLAGLALDALGPPPTDGPLVGRVMAADQSNTGIVYGTSYLLKLFRVVEEGPNAELELGRFLSTRTDYRGVPPIAGAVEYRASGEREPSTLGVMSAFVPNQGDAWTLTMDSLARYYDEVLSGEASAGSPPPITGSLVERARTAPDDQVIDWIGAYLDRSRLLGLRSAELHLVLASEPNDPLFAPQPFDIMHQQSMYGSASGHLARTFDLLRSQVARFTGEQRALVELVLPHEAHIDRQLAAITTRRIDATRIRIHGDYHLAQVLWTGDDLVIIDFEGEPGRPLSQRRFKRSPLRDVAGMIRSFHYASAAALRDGRLRHEDVARLAAWAPPWADWVSAAFLGGYLDRAKDGVLMPKKQADLELLLGFFLLEKCIYEVGYELNQRPDWIEIPLRGLIAHANLSEPVS